jgi:hypothetical protein
MRRFVLLVATILVVLTPVAAASIALVTTWGRHTHPGKGYDRAPEALPVLRALERDRVTFLRTQDWCQAYDDGNGIRANTLQGTCTLTPDAAYPFDPVTRARYETLAHLAEDLPYRMNYVEITYGGDGRMTRADISLSTFFSRASLIYDPGYSLDELRREVSPDPTTYTPINADWYHVLEDWN